MKVLRKIKVLKKMKRVMKKAKKVKRSKEKQKMIWILVRTMIMIAGLILIVGHETINNRSMPLTQKIYFLITTIISLKSQVLTLRIYTKT